MENGLEYTHTLKYVLITFRGHRMEFYILACAEVYRIIHGGEIHCEVVEIGDRND